MVDLKNAKMEDFRIVRVHQRNPLTAESIARNLKIQRVHQMLRAIRRARNGEQVSTEPKGRLISSEEMPKELFEKFFGNEQQ